MEGTIGRIRQGWVYWKGEKGTVKRELPKDGQNPHVSRDSMSTGVRLPPPMGGWHQSMENHQSKLTIPVNLGRTSDAAQSTVTVATTSKRTCGREG